jgi:hypothetical protein
MEKWQEEVIRLLPPQHHEDILFCQTIGELWAGYLSAEFVKAHQTQPLDRATIRGVYDFAVWCVAHSGDRDVEATALIDFFEDLPREPSIWDELPHHMTREQFLASREIYELGMTTPKHRQFIPHVLERFDLKDQQERKRRYRRL